MPQQIMLNVSLRLYTPPPSNSEDVDKLKKNDDCFPNCIEKLI